MFKSPRALWGNDWMGIDGIKGFGVRKVGINVLSHTHGHQSERKPNLN